MKESLADKFVGNGYIVEKVGSHSSYQHLVEVVESSLRKAVPNAPEDLSDIHRVLDKEDVNRIRVEVYKNLNQTPGIVEDYYKVFQPYINQLIGIDLASQDKINLSIQLPKDETSLVGLHTDTVSGQSEFEVVCWLPITRAFDSNSVYIFDRGTSNEMLRDLPSFQGRGMEELYQKWSSKSTSLSIEPGECLVFSSTLMHGNRINQTDSTRISLNFRFKALLSPYNNIAHSEKKIGNFYRPFRISPVTKVALDFYDLGGEFSS